MIRAFIWVLIRLIYRIRVRGSERLPSGGAILTPNHVSFIDAILIAAHIRRPVRYAMYWKLYNRFRWIVGPMGAFPIAGKDERPDIYAAAFDIMSESLSRGDLVCLFPEGKITTDGNMNPFRSGLLKVLARNPVPVVPVGLSGLWGSYFSKARPGVFKLPTHFMAEITMTVGEPLTPDTELSTIQERVADLVG